MHMRMTHGRMLRGNAHCDEKQTKCLEGPKLQTLKALCFFHWLNVKFKFGPEMK